ncbi:hypothetical protein CEP51_012942 [Fusarium floridanum]|uniref:Histidine-specific methyltransferase SAM-dependent domain-containing protein n=1 Tax=Fusarium floridanum TaxID=1325733 RepID=A0A428QKF8_9HYPO|nr:hypothetical protein CEP51_012942 [Fusarium floridanum]
MDIRNSMLTSVDRDSTKMTPFLDLLEPLPIKCRYYGVDVNKKAVDEKVMKFNEKYTKVECSGVHATFEDGIAMAATQAGKKVIISLGSTVTNFDPTQALENLRKLCRGDNLVILGQQGPDAVTGRHGDKVHRDAYHTERFEKFIWQGMLGTGNEVLRKKVFTEKEWEIKCEILHRPWRHQFVFHYKGEERFRGFVSFKYHEHEIISMIKETGAPSPEIYRHRETAMRIYAVDCLGN